MPLGHKLKILKRIKMLRQEKGMSVPESRQGQRPRPMGNQEVGAEVKPVSKADYSELPPPKMNAGSTTGQPPVKSALKGSSQPPVVGGAPPSKSINSHTPGGSLLDGKFDEGESHSSFLDALKAWRGEPTPSTTEDTQKSVRFQGDSTDKPAPGKKNFFANLDNQEFNVNCLPEPPTFSEGGTKPDAQMSDPKYGPKESCWQCYKLYPRDNPVTCPISNKVSSPPLTAKGRISPVYLHQ